MPGIRRLSFACAVATWFAVSPLSGTAAGKSESAASISKAPNIANFGQINGTYYRGEQPDGRDYSDLAGLGVKTVIDLQRDGKAAERQAVEAAGMKFHRIPMTTRTAPTSEQLALFLQLVNDPANQPVYVHCAGGRHRTGVMTAVYRMTHDGWTPDQAFREMKQYDFGADFLHPEFKQFVYSYRVEPDRGLAAPRVIAASAGN
jgi:tyrosine-protein phosphatase SIW14